VNHKHYLCLRWFQRCSGRGRWANGSTNHCWFHAYQSWAATVPDRT